MPSSDYLEHLAQIRLFSSCNNKELAKIAKASDELSIAQGKVLMAQGQAGREAFVIVDGTATVSVGDVDVAELGPGHHVGELALLDGGPRTATVTAKTDMTVLVISQRAFFGLLDEVPGLARKILASLAGMVRELDEQLAPHA
jgi:CRP-like cAMP-binding protein